MAICLGGMVAAFAPTKRDLTVASPLSSLALPFLPCACVHFCLMLRSTIARIVWADGPRLLLNAVARCLLAVFCCMVKKQNKVGGAGNCMPALW